MENFLMPANNNCVVHDGNMRCPCLCPACQAYAMACVQHVRHMRCPCLCPACQAYAMSMIVSSMSGICDVHACVQHVRHMRCPCLCPACQVYAMSMLVSSMSGIVFSSSAGIIADHKDPYFKSQLYAKDLPPPKAGTDFSNGPSKTERE